MKKIIVFSVLLLSFGLCACSRSLPVETSTEEPSATAAVPEEINIDEPIDTASVSIDFIGETITAPGYYPGVPDEYIPVLDDLYLFGELTLRYNTLDYEDKITTEITDKYVDLKKEISKRDHLPYPGDGLGITGGYMLVDLDGDNSLELLILNNYHSPYYDTQAPVIKSLFAIRNGQLVCIDDGAGKLNDAILAADNTFYQCIDWRGVGYADLTAFRLEPGMSEFTIVSEAHSALSFADGDIPVPYWIKTENGKEINIKEDEFAMLYEQCKSPGELMVLDFVPLQPDAVDPWSVPHPTDEPTTIQIEYPAAYPDAPEAYKPILDSLLHFTKRMRLGEYDFNEDMDVIGFSEYPYPNDGDWGYALVDLNSDGVMELLLGSMDGLNDSAPSSIFTLKDGQPVLVTSFWARNYGVISADRTIYNVGSGGAAYTYLSSYRFDKNADSLTELTDIRSDYSSSEEKPYYIQIIEGRNHYISEQEFDDYLTLYANPPERMKLTCIPVEP